MQFQNKNAVINVVTKFLLNGTHSRLKITNKDINKNMFENVTSAIEDFCDSNLNRTFYYIFQDHQANVLMYKKQSEEVPQPMPDFYVEICKNENSELSAFGHLFKDACMQDLLTGTTIIAKTNNVTDAIFDNNIDLKTQFLDHTKSVVEQHINNHSALSVAEKRLRVLNSTINELNDTYMFLSCPKWLIDTIASCGEIYPEIAKSAQVIYLLFETIPLPTSDKILKDHLLKVLTELAELNLQASPESVDLVRRARNFYFTETIDDQMRRQTYNTCSDLWNSPAQDLSNNLLADAIAAIIISPAFFALLIYDLHLIGITPANLTARVFNSIHEAYNASKDL